MPLGVNTRAYAAVTNAPQFWHSGIRSGYLLAGYKIVGDYYLIVQGRYRRLSPIADR
jgi:hypothetical protein